MLKTNNIIPRCSKGTVYMKSKSNLKWLVLYVGTKDGNVKNTYYTKPRCGCIFMMKTTLLNKYQYLVHFASTKPITAMLCQDIIIQGGLPITNISPIAINHELENVIKTRNHYYDLLDTKNRSMTEHQKMYMFYQYYSTHFLKYTLVMHPVGRHFDVFAGKLPSLENRVCFSFPVVKGNTGVCKTQSNYGRGGCGLTNFCFALLDWRN